MILYYIIVRKFSGLSRSLFGQHHGFTVPCLLLRAKGHGRGLHAHAAGQIRVSDDGHLGRLGMGVLMGTPKCQWPFQEPIYWRYRYHIFLAYFLGLCKGIFPQNMALYGTNVPPF